MARERELIRSVFRVYILRSLRFLLVGLWNERRSILSCCSLLNENCEGQREWRVKGLRLLLVGITLWYAGSVAEHRRIRGTLRYEEDGTECRGYPTGRTY